MGLSNLINHQTIGIDNHIPGTELVWGKGIHIHKEMNRSSDIAADIRLPLDTDQKLSIQIVKNKQKKEKSKKEKRLYSEIRDALEDKDIRASFVKEVLNFIENNCVLPSREKISVLQLMESANRIAQHFDLLEMIEPAEEYLRDDILSQLTIEYINQNSEKYYLLQDIDRNRILIGSDKSIIDNWDIIINRFNKL